MDTYVTIQAQGNERVIEAIHRAFERMEAVDKKFNILEPSSALFRFNHQSMPLTDTEILALMDRAMAIHAASDGAFDITVYPLIELWGFFRKSPALPAQREIDALLAHVGVSHLRREEGRISKGNRATQIDLGGIAKGYAIQAGIEALRAAGVTSALVDAGGDLYALGTLNGTPWRIGIRNPRGEGIVGDVEVADMAVVTSGDYERYFLQDGRRYHHLLNPRTGYPARGLSSVTVMSKDPVKADAFATAVFILGKEKGLALVNATPDLEAFFITEEGARFASSGL